MDMFHQFYVQIEQIRGIYIQRESIEEKKSDITSIETKELIISDDTEFIENNDIELLIDNFSLELDRDYSNSGNLTDEDDSNEHYSPADGTDCNQSKNVPRKRPKKPETELKPTPKYAKVVVAYVRKSVCFT